MFEDDFLAFGIDLHGVRPRFKSFLTFALLTSVVPGHPGHLRDAFTGVFLSLE
jgi:hypothetical protein